MARERHHHRRGPVRRTRAGISAFGYYGVPTYGMGVYQGVLGDVTSTGQTGHLNPDQFVGYPGGYSTNAGNMTGVEAIEGAAGNGGAGGDGDSGGGDGGSS